MMTHDERIISVGKPRGPYKERYEKITFYVHYMLCDNPHCGMLHEVEIAQECVLPKKIGCFECVIGQLKPRAHAGVVGKTIIQRKLKITR